MIVLNASEARRDLFPLIQRVNDDRDAVTITSKRGNAVLISLDEYESLQETAHLLRSPRNAQRLLESLEQLRAGQAAERAIVDPA